MFDILAKRAGTYSGEWAYKSVGAYSRKYSIWHGYVISQRTNDKGALNSHPCIISPVIELNALQENFQFFVYH